VHPTSLKVQERLREWGLDVEVRELAESTRTVAEAAAAVGCEVAQIVKSLVFVSAGEPLLCLCAGDRRVDPAKLRDDVRRANADEVREATGFAISGVPPTGHGQALATIADASLRRFETVWCAAGTPNAVFPVRVEELLAALADGRVAAEPFA